MFATIRRKLKWNINKSNDYKNQTSLLFIAFIGILEDVLFWKKMWLSLIFILVLNIFFFMCVHQEINLLQFIFKLSIVILGFDAFETWLKYKHRTTCLKKLANHDLTNFKLTTLQLKNWLKRRWLDYILLRERNHTKAFLLVQIMLGLIFFICKHTTGYSIMYMLVMILCISYKLLPPVVRFMKRIQQNAVKFAESDLELEGLVPDDTDANMDLLSIDQEQNQVIDEKQSLDYWKPEDVPIEEVSDSSDNSSSLVTNLSIEKMHTFEKEIETSDSSEDEYIPRVKYQPKEQFQSTLVVEPANTWTNAAYNVFHNLGGAVANIIYTPQEDNKRKRVPSIDSSDGFEMIDKNDIL